MEAASESDKRLDDAVGSAPGARTAGERRHTGTARWGTSNRCLLGAAIAVSLGIGSSALSGPAAAQDALNARPETVKVQADAPQPPERNTVTQPETGPSTRAGGPKHDDPQPAGTPSDARSAAADAAEPRRTSDGLAAASTESVCASLGAAAADNDLPLAFFTRLIWQESRFKTRAVSRAGAQGVAQFMPRTAAWRGLADPFDPVQALPQAAAYLRDLRQEFGNLGLAAAAYNGGSGRLRNWLAKRGELPRETRDYVAVITGHTVDDWATADRSLDALAFPAGIPCTDIAALLAAPRGGKGPKGAARTTATRSVLPWGVQLAANWSEGKALASFARMREQFQSILSGREPVVLRGRAGRGATMHRIRIALESRQSAEQLCSRLRAAGGACAVLRN